MKRPSPVLFVLGVVVINMLGVGLAWPVLPKLLQSFEGGSVSRAAFDYGFIAIIYAVAQFAFAPLLGRLSDAYGRRPVLLASQAGLCVDYFVLAIAPNFWWLLVARFVSGSLSATISAASACLADISSPEDRARNFGYLGAAFGIGFILGPAVGGLLGDIGIRLPFYAAAFLTAANCVFGYFLLPETLTPDKRRPIKNLWYANPFSALARLVRFRFFIPLFASFLLITISARGQEAIWVLYADFRFGWTLRDSAISLAFIGLMYILVQGRLVGPAVRLFGERRVILGGFGLTFLSFLVFTFVDRGWLAYILIVTYVLGYAISEPALRALCSRMVDADRQGMLQGVFTSISSMGLIIGPFTASMILANVSGPRPVIDLPGAWYALGAFLCACATLMVLFGFRYERTQRKTEKTQ